MNFDHEAHDDVECTGYGTGDAPEEWWSEVIFWSEVKVLA